jgi:hypothetical protein
MEFWQWLIDTSRFKTPVACGGWTLLHQQIQVATNFAIFLVFVTIAALLLAFLVSKSRQSPFHRNRVVAVSIAGIFFLCGCTHLMRAINFHYPCYRLTAAVLILTVVWSWLTLAGMVPLLIRWNWMERDEAVELAATRLEAIQQRMLEDEQNLNRLLIRIQQESVVEQAPAEAP